MKLHLIVGIFALFFICCVVAYVAVAPPSASAEKQYPGEPVTGEPTQAANGVKYYEMKVGTGATIPGPSTKFHAKYAGYLKDGTRFDGNDDYETSLDSLIPGWTDGLKGVKVGGKRKLIIPPGRGYGLNPRDKIPAGSTLIFDIELLSVK
jgi:FKBP-type peptidyl-prolyl cis-trans isomerase